VNNHASPRLFNNSVRGFLQKRGFGRQLAAFAYSIAITKVMGAFIKEVSCVLEFVIGGNS
jgi:hypothetical protein